MSEDRVLLEINDGIADVRLNRPEKLNALDTEMFQSIVRVGESLKERSEVRAVVLSGAGDSFCSGADFAGMDLSELLAVPDGQITHVAQQAVWVWREIEVPVIGAIHGHTLGGGLQIALGPDLRIVHPEAKLSLLEIRWGAMPDMAASVTLAGLVGTEVMKEMYFTGRMVSGVEAVELGLALRTSDDPHSAAMELASEIASKNPDAIKSMKSLLNGVDQRTQAENLALEREYIGQILGSPNQVEASRAFAQKRKPDFT
ncbi:MAG: crotonase/enoyl-CoA hydratase family protein [Acidimicrobiales bacterium]